MIDKIMIVAHPDDEMLWGGMNLLLDSGWHVIVTTHGNKKDFRSNEFKNSIKYTGAYEWKMYDIKDKYIEFPATADHLYNKNTLLLILYETW